MEIEIEKELLIWICAFYEGEGTICNDSSNGNSLRVSIYQNENCFLEFKNIWGGKIYKRVRKSPVSDKICTNHEWRLCNKNALKFINDIKPYMRIKYKIEQINNAINKQYISPNIKYKCTYCDKVYANPSGKSRHIRLNHLNSDASVCNN